MSLFSKLQSLGSDRINRLEDYHTEIVAYVLENYPEFTVKWLAHLRLTAEDDPYQVLVRTQEELPPLPAHGNLGGRPDISIRIKRGQCTELAYMESKIGSKEGGEPGPTSQLRRYSDHLLAKMDFSKRSLIYITRDFEPKEAPDGEGIGFKQCRWYDFYQFLKESEPNPTGIIKELMSFMEENNMSQSNQFSLIDILALSNFERARKIMDRTMWERVSAEFERVAGGVSSRKAASTQLRDHDRYVMIVVHGKGWQFEILLGYYLEQGEVGAYPQVGVEINVNPNASNRAAIVSAMQDFEKQKGKAWETSGLADEHDWGGIAQMKGLQEFLSEEDHVKKVEEYFMRLLDDVREFKTRHPKLPWNPQKADQEET